mmetsp:Transcript_33008/g.53359  ORF Transcript_33008/g.53359 Transcript_33008/m.53359 type:complete len:229 (+) Transcript_33008:512-1198(+)
MVTIAGAHPLWELKTIKQERVAVTECPGPRPRVNVVQHPLAWQLPDRSVECGCLCRRACGWSAWGYWRLFIVPEAWGQGCRTMEKCPCSLHTLLRPRRVFEPRVGAATAPAAQALRRVFGQQSFSEVAGTGRQLVATQWRAPVPDAVHELVWGDLWSGAPARLPHQHFYNNHAKLPPVYSSTMARTSHNFWCHVLCRTAKSGSTLGSCHHRKLTDPQIRKLEVPPVIE